MSGNMVEADPRKGQVTLKRDDSGLLNFQWRDRTSGSADEVSGSPPFPLSCTRRPAAFLLHLLPAANDDVS
jgi:hypothetical protein